MVQVAHLRHDGVGSASFGHRARSHGWYPGTFASGGAWKKRSLKWPLSVNKHRRAKLVYIEMPSSLMIYPMPYPSAATGPKPNKRRAGLPQLEVERIEVFRTLQPLSVKILGNEPLTGGRGTGSSSEGSRFPSCSRRSRQYRAYRCLSCPRPLAHSLVKSTCLLHALRNAVIFSLIGASEQKV